MPIRQNTVINFGTGEIAVIPGMTSDRKKGVNALKPQNPTPVGVTIKADPSTIDLNDIPILMEFSNIKSLDAVIKQLNVVRKHMTGELDINDSHP